MSDPKTITQKLEDSLNIKFEEWDRKIKKSGKSYYNGITKSGINRMIKWCKQDRHLIQYALDGNNFNLNDEEKQALVKEIIKMIS